MDIIKKPTNLEETEKGRVGWTSEGRKEGKYTVVGPSVIPMF